MRGGEAFISYAPLNVLKPVAENVWIADGPEIHFGCLGLKLPFPTRMTVIRLPSGGLWVHSPIALTQELAGRVFEVGEPQFLIAPNTLHYWYINDWKLRFPQALVYAAPNLRERARRPVAIDHTLEDEFPTAWAGAFAQKVVAGSMLT